MVMKKLQELIDSWKKEFNKLEFEIEQVQQYNEVESFKLKGGLNRLYDCISEAEELLKQQEGTNE